MKSVQINGYKVSYIDEGLGYPLIFIHNGGSSSLIWKRQKNYFLEKGYRIIIPDLIGCGESDLTDEPLSLQFHIDILKEFIRTLGINEAQMIGICIGSNISLSLIDQKGIECQSPILINPFPGKKAIDNILKKLVATIFVGGAIKLLYKIPANRLLPLKILFASRNYIKTLSKSDREEIKQHYLKRKYLKSRISLWRNMDSYTLNVPSFKKITPLIIWGKNNRVIPIKHSNHVTDLFDSYQFKSIEHSGHFLMIEKPEELNELIREHLKNSKIISS